MNQVEGIDERSGLCVGVDFGSSRTKAAFFNPSTKQVEDVYLGVSQVFTPSIFHLSKNDGADIILVGDEAERRGRDSPGGLVIDIKAEIDSTSLIRRGRLEDKPTRKRLLALLFRYVMQRIKIAHPSYKEERFDCCLTVPVSFDENKRNCIRDAAIAAGFHNPILLEEPVAAAQAWLRSVAHPSDALSEVIVFDIGGGTSDYALLKKNGNKFVVSSLVPPSGNPCLGAGYLDRELADDIWESNPEVSDSPIDDSIYDCIRQIREGALTFENGEFQLRNISGKPLNIGQQRYNELVSRFCDRIVADFEQFLNQCDNAGIQTSTPIVMIGGGSKIRGLQDRLADKTHRSVYQWHLSDCAVARGAVSIPGSPTEAVTHSNLVEYQRLLNLFWKDKSIEEKEFDDLREHASSLGIPEDVAARTEREILGVTKEEAYRQSTVAHHSDIIEKGNRLIRSGKGVDALHQSELAIVEAHLNEGWDIWVRSLETTSDRDIVTESAQRLIDRIDASQGNSVKSIVNLWWGSKDLPYPEVNQSGIAYDGSCPSAYACVLSAGTDQSFDFVHSYPVMESILNLKTLVQKWKETTDLNSRARMLDLVIEYLSDNPDDLLSLRCFYHSILYVIRDLLPEENLDPSEYQKIGDFTRKLAERLPTIANHSLITQYSDTILSCIDNDTGSAAKLLDRIRKKRLSDSDFFISFGELRCNMFPENSDAEEFMRYCQEWYAVVPKAAYVVRLHFHIAVYIQLLSGQAKCVHFKPKDIATRISSFVKNDSLLIGNWSEFSQYTELILSYFVLANRTVESSDKLKFLGITKKSIKPMLQPLIQVVETSVTWGEPDGVASQWVFCLLLALEDDGIFLLERCVPFVDEENVSALLSSFYTSGVFSVSGGAIPAHDRVLLVYDGGLFSSNKYGLILTNDWIYCNTRFSGKVCLDQWQDKVIRNQIHYIDEKSCVLWGAWKIPYMEDFGPSLIKAMTAYAKTISGRSLSRVADPGDAEDQYALDCHPSGEGVEKKKSVLGLIKAEEQGDAEAQYNFGLDYANGKGVEKDLEKAVFWYAKAAEQGYAIAQHKLGVCYGSGLGVPQDYVLAHKWFNIASSLGRESSTWRLKMLKAHMTPAQIAEAQKLAKEWLANWKEKGK